MILCDLCGQARECEQKEIEGKEYDICAECWKPLAEKLKGKGRARKERETVFLPNLPKEPEPPGPKPVPSEPPKIGVTQDARSERALSHSCGATTNPFHSFAKRRIIATAGGTYAVPAFRPSSSLHAAVATCSWIPNTTPPAVPDQAAMVGHLDRSECALAGSPWRDSSGALLGDRSDDGGYSIAEEWGLERAPA